MTDARSQTAVLDLRAPSWDLESVYPGVTSDALVQDVKLARDGIASLRDALSSLDVTTLDATRLAAFLDAYNRTTEIALSVKYFAHATVTANGADEAAVRLDAEASVLMTDLSAAVVRLPFALGQLDTSAIDRLCADPRVADHALFVRTLADEGRHMMPPEQEELALELGKSAIQAWQRHYRAETASLTFEVVSDAEGSSTVPISAAHGFLASADRRVRESAYHGLREAWSRRAESLSASLNAIAGAQLALSTRRGDRTPYASSLRGNRVRESTVDAMWSAIRRRLPEFRRFLHAKARALGVPRLAAWDITAPLPGADSAPLEYPDAVEFIAATFDGFHKPLGDFARMAHARRWVDAAQRAGKSTGGYCTHLPRVREPRIFMSYGGRSSMRTLAHELGHAWHYWLMRDLPPTQSELPMTLAETASTFAETLVVLRSLDHAEGAAKSAILGDRATFLFNILPMILSRFEFERRLYELRRAGELSPRELDGLARECFATVFGDAIDLESLSGHTWASTAHHFFWPFYNYPYSYGTLLSLGLYVRARDEGAAFVPKLERFLRHCGTHTPEDLGRGMGIDLESDAFWTGAVDLAVGEVAAFDAAIAT